MISVDEMPLDRGAYNLLTLLMSFFVCLWIIRALLSIRSLAFLRAATLQGRTVTLRGLGAYVHIFEAPTQNHMQSILHTRQSRPPKRVPALLLPVLPCQDAQAKVQIAQESVLVPVHVVVACAVTPVWLLEWDQIASQFREEVVRSRRHGAGGSSSGNATSSNHNSGGTGSGIVLMSGRKAVRLERSPNAIISKQAVLQPGKNEIQVPMPPSPGLQTLVLICEPCAKDAMLPVTTIQTEQHAASTSSTSSVSRVSLLGGRIFSKHDNTSDAQATSPHTATSFMDTAMSSSDVPCDALMLVYELHASTVSAKDRYVAVDGVLFALQEVYGLKGRATDLEAQADTPRGSDDQHEPRDSGERGEDEDVCIVCFTEPMQVVLLPCRHLSVCTGCFSHIDKCPVCRAPFEQYLTLETDRKAVMQTQGFQPNGNGNGHHDSHHRHHHKNSSSVR